MLALRLLLALTLALPTVGAVGTCEVFGDVCADVGVFTWGDPKTHCESVGEYRGVEVFGGGYLSNWGIFVIAYDSCFTTDNGAYHHVGGIDATASASTIGAFVGWDSAERVNEPEGDFHRCDTFVDVTAAGFGPYGQSLGCPAGDPPTYVPWLLLP